MSEESHQSSACFRFFLRLACFEYYLLASEENEEDREVSLLVLLSEACSESPQLSELLRVVHLSEPARFWPAGTNRKRQTARFFRGFPSPQSFVQQNKTCNTRSFKKLSYSSHMTETRTEFQTCRGTRLTRETKILHQGGLKFTREFLKNHQVPGRSKFHQGGQNNSPGRVPPDL